MIFDYPQQFFTEWLGAMPTNFCDFHIKKHSFITLFIKKMHTVNAVTVDNAKLFSQLMYVDNSTLPAISMSAIDKLDRLDCSDESEKDHKRNKREVG